MKHKEEALEALLRCFLRKQGSWCRSKNIDLNLVQHLRVRLVVALWVMLVDRHAVLGATPLEDR